MAGAVDGAAGMQDAEARKSGELRRQPRRIDGVDEDGDPQFGRCLQDRPRLRRVEQELAFGAVDEHALQAEMPYGVLQLARCRSRRRRCRRWQAV